MSLRVSSGLQAWTLQRFSALYMALFFCYAVFSFVTRHASDYQAWVAWVAYPFNQIAIGLFVLSLLLHAWVGARDIVLDYVHPFGLRITKLAMLAFLLIAMGLWALKVLLNVAAV